MKKLFLIAALLMTANLVSFGQEKAGGELATDEFYLKLMSPNIQTRQGLDEYLTSPGGSWNSLASYNNLYQIYLAKHEKEAFQIYYHERGTGHDIRLEIGDYLDSGGNILPHTIYKEEFFTVENVSSDFFAEALVPYNGESIHVDNGQKCVFYVELESAPDQPAGVYTSTFALYEGDELMQSHEITALVWNFALPEAHYGTTFAGLYNSVSGYGATKGFLEKSGVNFQGGDPASDADRVEAERILEGWQKVLLDHGVSTYEIPRFMIDSDQKNAELAMADIRRKAFVVPSYSSEKILQYKDIVYNNPILANKSLFYYKDEPQWTGEDHSDYIQTQQIAEYLESLWPEFHSVIPTYNGSSFVIQKLKEMTDIFCPNQALIAGNQNIYNTFTDGSWHRTWRYLPQNHLGCIAVTRWNKMHMGTMAKAVYWQQEALNSDGILNWNIGFVPYVNGTPYDVWENHSIYPAISPANVNGEGIFLYESASLGLDPANPIVSLRLKHMSNGMDDYDYLQLAKEAFGTDEDSPYMQAMNTVFRFYTSAGHQYIFSCESSPWDGNHPYEWIAHYDDPFVNARILLGNALSEAMAGQHEYGEWQTAVLPDETHNGLEIRTCAHCGAQESRSKSYASLYRFVGTESDQWADLGNWANIPEALPSSGEAVVIASNCEINTNTKVFHVVVNNGCTLTIKNGATLESSWVSTEGNAQVIIEDGAQLYTQSEGVHATVKKNIEAYTIAQSVGDNLTDGWYFIASPLTSSTSYSGEGNIVNNLITDTYTGDDNSQRTYDFYRLDNSVNPLKWRNYRNSNFSMDNGAGYLYASKNSTNLQFSGEIKPYSSSGNTVTLSNTGWNLIGNPFTCAVTVDAAFAELNNGNAVTNKEANSPVNPCAGIAVNGTAGEAVTFTVASSEAPTTTNNRGLQITLAEANTRGAKRIDNAIVSFSQGAVLPKFRFGDNAEIYIPMNGEDYAIVSVGKDAVHTVSSEVPVNFKAAKDGIYTLSVNPENVEMAYLHLIDNMTGADVDLLTPIGGDAKHCVSTYTFEARTTDYESRFRLVFSTQAPEPVEGPDQPFAFISNGDVIINGEGTLQVIDVTGRVLFTREVNSSLLTLHSSLTAGVYVLRLINSDNVKTQKIVVE